jgi:hypothetical protein
MDQPAHLVNRTTGKDKGNRISSLSGNARSACAGSGAFAAYGVAADVSVSLQSRDRRYRTYRVLAVVQILRKHIASRILAAAGRWFAPAE